MSRLSLPVPDRTDDGHAILWAVAEWTGEEWLLTGFCPVCLQEHLHGGGIEPEEPVLGHRYPHCTDVLYYDDADYLAGYFLQLAHAFRRAS